MRGRARLALCLAVLAVLAACAPGGGRLPSLPTGATVPTSAATPSPAASPATLTELARTAGTPLASGDLTLALAALGTVVADARADGSVVATLSVPAGAGEGTGAAARRVEAVVAAPSGLRFAVRADGSVAVLGSAGDVVGALAPVVAVDAAGRRLAATLMTAPSDDGLLEVVVDAGLAGTTTVTLGATPLVSATWGDREGGRSLAVVPAAWVRSGSLAAQDALWSALVTAEPEADSTTMRDQLGCHALGAADKDSWNLEPWRPEVDSFTLLATRCNP